MRPIRKSFVARSRVILLVVSLLSISCSDDPTTPREPVLPPGEESPPFITLVCSDSDTLIVPASGSLCVDLPPGMSLGAGCCLTVHLSGASDAGGTVAWYCVGYDSLDPRQCEIEYSPFNKDPWVVCLRSLTFSVGTHTLLIEVVPQQNIKLRFCIKFAIS